MKSLYLYFKLLFSEDEKLIAKWSQLSDEKVTEKYKGAMAKELQKRNYHYDGIKWVKSST